MARKPKPATAAKPDNPKPQDTQGANDSHKGTQISDEAEAPQPPTESKPVGSPAGGNEPPVTNPPDAEPGLAAVMSEVVPDGSLSEVLTEEKPARAAKVRTQDVLVVIGPKRGRWRAGWHFGPEPTRIPLAELTEDECAAITGDPALTAAVEAGA